MESLTLEQAYYIGELIAAFVVLVSLAYMAIQLRQNTIAIKLGTAHAVTEEFRGMFSLVATSPGVIAGIVSAAQEPYDLDGVDKAHYYTFSSNFILAYQNAYLQMEKGILEKEQWEGMTRMMIDYTNTPGFKEYWPHRKHWTSYSFQQFMDNNVVPTESIDGVSLPGEY
jgi:hypothetical protein